MQTARRYSPKNPWGRILDTLRAPDQTASALEHMKFHGALEPDLVAIFKRHIQTVQGPGTAPEKLNLPEDLTRNQSGALRLPFRRLMPGTAHPTLYPSDMVLPRLAAARNDVWPLHQAASAVAADPAAAVQRILVLYQVDDPAAAETVLAALAAQRGPSRLDIALLVPGASEDARARLGAGCPGAQILPFDILSPHAAQFIQAALPQVSAVAFLQGQIAMDRALFDRARMLLQVSDRVVQGLWPMEDTMPAPTPFAVRSARAFEQRYPFRQIKGLNMIVPADLLRRAGPIDRRFADPALAARELAWRCFNLGAWFSPLLVGGLRIPSGAGDAGADLALLRDLCPNSWDRPEDGHYQVPKVSIYIPAYNCAKYIEQAVGSVLEQDVQDLEVCLAIDGSPDNTLDILARQFGDDTRVRFEDGPNGGIGHASNRAIQMTRGLYVGQLDSDDRLKPGAVRRLMGYLDENPDVACCYGSCERVDADGQFMHPEYSWPTFSREKMMVTSIVHHFRMFRRAAWERTGKFRTDIVNAVDYDMFLKLSETGWMHHIDEVLYQRRWHGENTSSVHESHQTSNTYRVQREALGRLNLDRFWDVHVPNKEQPRLVTYQPVQDQPRLVFWPDYSRANPYQHLLYQDLSDSHEILAGPVKTALEMITRAKGSGPLIFHLHWTNFLFTDVENATMARANVACFLTDLRAFKAMGGQVVWTVHNLVSHESPFLEIEKELIRQIITIADVVHFHAASSVAEFQALFDLPRAKVRIAPHGSYIGVYADHIDRQTAREILQIAPEDEVILHTGQIRAYKGVEDLITAFRAVLPDRPHLRLLIAGAVQYDVFAGLENPLSDAERARITMVDRFVDETEFQLFYRAADLAVFPYKSILTSGSLLLALGFGVPVVIPAVGMTRDVLADGKAGRIYAPGSPDALPGAIRQMLDAGPDARAAALEKARAAHWRGLKPILAELVKDTDTAVA